MFLYSVHDNINKLLKFLDRGAIGWLIRMRQVCIYPSLVADAFKKSFDYLEGLEEENEDELEINMGNAELKNYYIDSKQDINNFIRTSLSSSSKINAIIKKILEESRNERKIIFCHYTDEIKIIREILKRRGILAGVINGKATQKQRESIIQKTIHYNDFRLICKKFYYQAKYFYNNISSFTSPEVLIIQIQTASEGLNLQHFNQVYFTSPWWNPALEDQAIARAHRIGQKYPVKVFRFVMEGFGKESITLDEYCLQVQKIKREKSNY